MIKEGLKIVILQFLEILAFRWNFDFHTNVYRDQMTCPQDIEINQDYLIAHEQSRINACNIYLRHTISSFEKRYVGTSAKCESQN